MAEAVLSSRILIKILECFPLGRPQGASVGPLGEAIQECPVALFCRFVQQLQSGDLPRGVREVIPNGLPRGVTGVISSGFGLVEFPESPDFFGGMDRLILGSKWVELWVTQEGRVGSLKPHETRQHAMRNGRQEPELVPQLVQLALTGIAQNEVVEGLVVAEVAGHAVQACAEQSAGVFLLLLRVEVHTAAFSDVEGVREEVGETSEGRLVFCTGHRVSRDLQLRQPLPFLCRHHLREC